MRKYSKTALMYLSHEYDYFLKKTCIYAFKRFSRANRKTIHNRYVFLNGFA